MCKQDRAISNIIHYRWGNAVILVKSAWNSRTNYKRDSCCVALKQKIFVIALKSLFTKVFSGRGVKFSLAGTKTYMNATVKPVARMHYCTGRLQDQSVSCRWKWDREFAPSLSIAFPKYQNDGVSGFYSINHRWVV